jgi:GntR family transcriptional regulator/MocR family aminotransferase
MRRTYLARRGALAASLEKHLRDTVSFDLPPGGMSLWLQVDPQVDVDRWAERAERVGVIINTGRRFDFRGQARPNLRLGFSSLDERELELAVRRLAKSLRA